MKSASPAGTPAPTRATCYECLKPQVTCICDRIEPVDNRTAIIILQHAHERRHPIGTARIARLGLSRIQLRVIDPDRVGGTRPVLGLPPDAALLYPRDPSRPDGRARDLADLPPSEHPSALVVLDGTWSHAHRLYQFIPSLRALDHVGLSPAGPSRYRIRRQPSEHCISTLESVLDALRILEPLTPGLDDLRGVFHSMIDDQITFEHNARRQRASRRGGPSAPAETG